MILASDYDFTLHFKDGISQNDLKMIHEFRNKGGLFGLISGRSISSLQYEINKFKIPYDFIIGVNGGFILDTENKEIFSSYINKDEAHKIIAYLNANPPSSYTLHNGYDLARKVFDEDFPLNINADFIDFDTLLTKDISGFFINYPSSEVAQKEVKILNEKFPFVLSQINGSFVDVTALNINKKEGLKKLVDTFEHTKQVYVIGDAENDLEMIEHFPSFAMRHGDDCLKKKADIIVDSVAQAIEHILSQDLQHLD